MAASNSKYCPFSAFNFWLRINCGIKKQKINLFKVQFDVVRVQSQNREKDPGQKSLCPEKDLGQKRGHGHEKDQNLGVLAQELLDQGGQGRNDQGLKDQDHQENGDLVLKYPDLVDQDREFLDHVDPGQEFLEHEGYLGRNDLVLDFLELEDLLSQITDDDQFQKKDHGLDQNENDHGQNQKKNQKKNLKIHHQKK